MNPNILAISLLVILIGATTIAHKINSKKNLVKESYTDMFSATDYANGNWVSRPTFRADLSPRFDSTRVGGGNIVGSFPGLSVQGAPVTPVESILDTSANPSYAAMGGPSGAYADPRLPNGGLTTSQINKILTEKFGRGQQEYVDPRALLPAPDMKKALAKDPSDPGTFMYDRYLFAPLKRRYPKVGVDFIRGDLAVPQLRMGWFDPAPVAGQDLIQGYFSDYLDIQQSTSLKDTLFERAPTQLEQSIPAGRLAEKTIYSLL
jgi:hypothetical protein